MTAHLWQHYSVGLQGELMTSQDECWFLVHPHHIALLKRIYFEQGESAYTKAGVPCVNQKRPYGNSAIEWDIIEICDLVPACERDDMQEEGIPDELYTRVEEIQREMTTVLQILAANPETGIQPGMYNCTKPWFLDWERSEEHTDE